MRHRTNCRGRTTNSSVTVTVTVSTSKHEMWQRIANHAEIVHFQIEVWDVLLVIHQPRDRFSKCFLLAFSHVQLTTNGRHLAFQQRVVLHHFTSLTKQSALSIFHNDSYVFHVPAWSIFVVITTVYSVQLCVFFFCMMLIFHAMNTITYY